jgi:hypothetical protein
LLGIHSARTWRWETASSKHKHPATAQRCSTHIEGEAHEVGAPALVHHVVQLELAHEVQRDDEGCHENQATHTDRGERPGVRHRWQRGSAAKTPEEVGAVVLASHQQFHKGHNSDRRCPRQLTELRRSTHHPVCTAPGARPAPPCPPHSRQSPLRWRSSHT